MTRQSDEHCGAVRTELLSPVRWQLPHQLRHHCASCRAKSARDRRTRGLNPPYWVASAEFETGLGQAGLQLVLTADIFDPDPRFLAIEGQQLDLTDRWY